MLLSLKSIRWLPSLLALLFTAVIAEFPGGIDIEVYESTSAILWGEGTAYYYKEFVSWGIIALAFDVIGKSSHIYALASISLFMWLCIIVFVKGASKNFYLALVLISPFGVLLSLNVLRQYIAVLFFFIAVINIVDKRYFIALFMSLLSIFSHNSFVIFVAILYSLYIFGPKLTVITAMALSLIASVVMSSSSPINAEGDEKLKLIMHFTYVLGIYVFIPFISYCCKWIKLDFGDYLFRLSLLSILMLLMLGAEVWQINRLLISLGFFLLLFIAYHILMREHYFGIRFFIITLLIFFNVLSLLQHGGAISMLNLDL